MEPNHLTILRFPEPRSNEFGFHACQLAFLLSGLESNVFADRTYRTCLRRSLLNYIGFLPGVHFDGSSEYRSEWPLSGFNNRLASGGQSDWFYESKRNDNPESCRWRRCTGSKRAPPPQPTKTPSIVEAEKGLSAGGSPGEFESNPGPSSDGHEIPDTRYEQTIVGDGEPGRTPIAVGHGNRIRRGGPVLDGPDDSVVPGLRGCEDGPGRS